MVLLRTLVHAGHIRVGVLVEFESLLVLNVIGMSVLSERGCVFVSEEAGHMGASLTGFVGPLPPVEGVSDGTQKEGSVSLAA